MVFAAVLVAVVKEEPQSYYRWTQVTGQYMERNKGRGIGLVNHFANILLLTIWF